MVLEERKGEAGVVGRVYLLHDYELKKASRIAFLFLYYY